METSSNGQIKLETSGRTVELRDLTFEQREECENAVVQVIVDGEMGMVNTAKARNLWCQFGLGLERRSDLAKYSSPELVEIATFVQSAACKLLDPTPPPSSQPQSG